MKKFILAILVALLMVSLSAEAPNWNSIESDGVLPKDGNRIRLQTGRYFEMRDSLVTSLEHLTSGTFADSTAWTGTNDIYTTADSAGWTWVDAVQSKLSQGYDSLAVVCRNAEVMRLTYDVQVDTAIEDGVVSMWVTGICDSTAMSVVAGTDKTVDIVTNASGAATDDFEIIIKADGDVTAGAISLDNLELTGYYISPVTIATGAEVVLYTPENAIELVIDPQGTEVKYEIGNAWFPISSLHSISVAARQTVTIANDSGASVTLYFYYHKI